jgi:hypothetical protein
MDVDLYKPIKVKYIGALNHSRPKEGKHSVLRAPTLYITPLRLNNIKSEAKQPAGQLPSKVLISS